jgi:hypothetical protein
VSAADIARAGDWRPTNSDEVTKFPDRLVHVAAICEDKAVLFDGWAVHNRTLHQGIEKKRENSLYNAIGYPVVRVGEWWSETLKRTEELKPKLNAAMLSADPVVDLTT